MEYGGVEYGGVGCGVWWTKLFIITPHTKVRGTHLSHSGGRYDLRRNICSFQCPTQ